MNLGGVCTSTYDIFMKWTQDNKDKGLYDVLLFQEFSMDWGDSCVSTPLQGGMSFLALIPGIDGQVSQSAYPPESPQPLICSSTKSCRATS